VVMAKARARIAAIVMAITPLQLCGDCQNRARTSVTAITFWRFFESQAMREGLPWCWIDAEGLRQRICGKDEGAEAPDRMGAWPGASVP
jgi:hypothetical protein